jgi:hypothetical protein
MADVEEAKDLIKKSMATYRETDQAGAQGVNNAGGPTFSV